MIFKEEIWYFRKLDKDKYCVLVFFVLFNNDFCIEDIWDFVILREIYNFVLEFCEMKKNIEFYSIGDVFEIF